MNYAQEMMDNVVEIGYLFAELKNSFLQKELYEEIKGIEKLEREFYQMVYPV